MTKFLTTRRDRWSGHYYR